MRAFCCKVVGKNGGKGLRATRVFSKGETVVSQPPGSLSRQRPSKYTLELSPHEHLECDAPLKYANHSFRPTCRVTFERGMISLIAKGPIRSGEALTIDYHATETDLAEPFVDSQTGRLVA
mmetsp:Transcript_4925/g.16147  ORF Transcript_4925/g.16147 Transcript_4925/m.16147 type:complete len:121 (+) Transcript_4925:60-422(+)